MVPTILIVADDTGSGARLRDELSRYERDRIDTVHRYLAGLAERPEAPQLR